MAAVPVVTLSLSPLLQAVTLDIMTGVLTISPSLLSATVTADFLGQVIPQPDTGYGANPYGFGPYGGVYVGYGETLYGYDSYGG